MAAKFINDNYGGQEWLNDKMFRNPKVRQFFTQLLMSLDWTWSQIKTLRWPFMRGGKTAQEQARRAFMRKIGLHHWFWYLSAIAGFSIAGNYAFSGKGPWENEKGHKLNIDWTNVWRSLPWNRDWKDRGDYSRRYIGLGKAGRELVRWFIHPLRAFGQKLSPLARTFFEQGTGYNLGSEWAEPWAREDLDLYEELTARFKHVMEAFKPFSLSGNNAFLAFPSSKGMTEWKAIRAYEDIYDTDAKIIMGGVKGQVNDLHRAIAADRERLMRQIAEACKDNSVDAEKVRKAALSGIRSKYYGRFWKATKRQDVAACDRIARALLALGVVPKGFKQSLEYRRDSLPEPAGKLGIERFKEAHRRQPELALPKGER